MDTMADNYLTELLNNIQGQVKRLADGQDKQADSLGKLHRKQDEMYKEQLYANGKLKRHDEEIKKLQKPIKITDKMDNKVLWIVAVTLALAVGGLVGGEIISGIGELLGG